jgi:hypothetical protein
VLPRNQNTESLRTARVAAIAIARRVVLAKTAETTEENNVAERPSHPASPRSVLNCIFFLTFGRSDSIYESHCDFLNRKFSIREIHFDEERNQESPRKEKGAR